MINNVGNILVLSYRKYTKALQPFKDGAQAALFKGPVRTTL
jgi:hypothetical protein